MSQRAKTRYENAVLGFALTSKESVKSFMDGLASVLQTTLRAQAQAPNTGKTCNLVISVTLGEEKFGPMVDMEWACAALPLSRERLKNYLSRHKARFDPPIYKRVRRPDGRNQRTRLLSLHDLKVLRGILLMKGPGRNALLARGDIA